MRGRASGLTFMREMRHVRRHIGQAYRYAHTLRVARYAERLAWLHGENRTKARLAGLYHDIARLYSSERLLAECAARALPIDAFEQANPIVLHARLGAELARDVYGIHDKSVLSSIRKHTVAAAEMSRLDMILYLADGLEPGRSFGDRGRIARLAEHDLDAGMQALLLSTVGYLQSRRLDVAPQTWAATRAFGVPVASVSGDHLEKGSSLPDRLPPLADFH